MATIAMCPISRGLPSLARTSNMERTALTRFASLSRGTALAILVLLVVLVSFGLWLSAEPVPPSPPSDARDIALHRALVNRVRAGENYETAAVAEHRAQGYPVRPFLTVRPPFLAMILSRLPNEKTCD